MSVTHSSLTPGFLFFENCLLQSRQSTAGISHTLRKNGNSMKNIYSFKIKKAEESGMSGRAIASHIGVQ